jgi:NADPH:quinone reductase-like Zn-dependent oxidoreductase
MMKAVVYTQYGSPDVLQFKEIEKPTPDDDQVLVKVHATSINATDWHSLTADIFLIRLMGGGLLKPKDTTLGVDFAGTVEAIGRNVAGFQPGDAVFGGRSGALAEYVCVKNAIALKPSNLSFDQAAAIPVAAVTALQGLRDKGHIQPGQKVLVNGASGGVGTFAVQIAKAFDAEVTAVCSTRNLDMARSLGADHVIDYKKEDFTRSGQRYDLILAANGYHPIPDYFRALKPGGYYVMAGGLVRQLFEGMILGKVLSKTSDKKVEPFLAKLTREDMGVLKDLAEADKITPFVEKVYPFSESVQAFRHFGEGHARGKIVIRME